MLNQQEQLQLSQDKLLLELLEQRGFKEVLRPYLEAKRSLSYPDPTEFKDEKEFLYASIVSSLFKKVISELLHYLEDEVPARVLALEAKDRGEDKTFNIGGELNGGNNKKTTK